MRTLKKTLALVLVLAMMFSLCAVSASADFTDADEITYAEAVDVLVAIGVIDGMPDGSFDADGILTRAQAAKIITYILGLEDFAIADGAPFADVAADHWAAGYIALCVDAGIVAGYGDGNFGPSDTLTGYQWAKMLLCAQGYNAEAAGMTGSAWQIATAKLAAKSALFVGDEKADKTKACTREAACLYAFNALDDLMVEYKGGTSITIGDLVFTAGGYETTTTTKLADLHKLAKVSEDVATDDGLNAHYWTIDGKEATGLYVDDVLVASYAAGTLYKTIAADMGASKTKTVSGAYYANGVEKTTFTANDYLNDTTTKIPAGVTADLYKTAAGEYKLMATVEYVVLANEPTEVKDKESDYYGKYAWTFGEYPAVVYAAKDAYTKDAAYVVVPQGDNMAATKYLAIAEAEYVQGKITAKGAGYVKMGDAKYTLAGEYTGETMAVGTEYVLYLASDGSVLLGVKPENAKTAETLVYVVGSYTKKIAAVAPETDAYGRPIKDTGVEAAVETYAQCVDMDGKEVSYLVGKTATEAVAVETDCVKAVKYDEATKLYVLATAQGAAQLELDEEKVSVNGYYYNNATYTSIVGAYDKLAISAGTLKAAAADDNAWVIFTTDAVSGNKTVSKVFYWAPAVVVDTTYSYALLATGESYVEEGSIMKKDAKVATPVYTYEVYINGEKQQVMTYTATLAQDFYKYAVDEYGVYEVVELDGAIATVGNVYGNYITATNVETSDVYTDYDVTGIKVVDLTTEGNGKIDKDDVIAFYAYKVLPTDKTYTIDCIYVIELGE